ncbi:MAG: low molecular weight protein-tyrosine-phosphatase [Paracoccaceae bacterium]
MQSTVRRVLFVCLGNICRSPAAEGVFRAGASQVGLEGQIDSAGTSDWHVGAPPYAQMQTAARQRGYDIGNLRARQFQRVDFDRFDLIIAMDADNLSDIEQVRPQGNETAVRLFLDFAPDTDLTDLPDPYYTLDFETALDLVERASQGLLAEII